jgi:hypothetical protein
MNPLNLKDWKREMLVAYIGQLREAGQDVANNWKRRDPAGAVNDLRLLIEHGPEIEP